MTAHLDELALDVLASGPDPRRHDLPQVELPEGWTLPQLREHLANCRACAGQLDDAQVFFSDLAPTEAPNAEPLVQAVERAIDGGFESPVEGGAEVLRLWPRRLAAAATLMAAAVVVAMLTIGPTTLDPTPAPVAPSARELAAELGIDLDAVFGEIDEALGSNDALLGGSAFDGLLDLDPSAVDSLLATLDQESGG
jgi:hypothetical protein